MYDGLLDMASAQKVSSHSRVKGNELAKGYYPTFQKDIDNVLEILTPNFGYVKKTGNNQRAVRILDPCAGAGEFLYQAGRLFKRNGRHDCCLTETFAVELDADRFGKIRAAQKENASWFDVQAGGKFEIILLNPPYNRNGGELVRWVQSTIPLLNYQGVMILIIPEH